MSYQLQSARYAPPYTIYRGVLKYYRPEGITRGQAWASLWKWHTETVNIWTMIINGGVTVAYGSWMIMQMPWLYVPIVGLFMAFVLAHMVASVGYHLFSPMSESISVYWRKLDVCLILGFGVLWTFCFNVFVFDLTWTLLLTFCASYIGYKEIKKIWYSPPTHDAQPGYAGLIKSYLLLIVCYLTGMSWLATIGDTVAFRCLWTVLACLFTSGAMLLLGWPERLSPGTFDLLGSSHQFMHLLLVNIAHPVEMYFIWYTYNMKHSKTCKTYKDITL